MLDNDADGNGRSTVISVTYVPEPQVGEDPGDPVTEDVPAGGSVTVDSLYGILTIYSDGRWEYLSDPYEAHDAPPSDAPLQDLFTYEVKDVDGDRVTSTLTIDVLDTEPLIDEDRVPRVDDAANPAVVDEDDLDPDGTDLNSDGKQPSYSGDLGVEKAADPIDTVFIEQIAPSGLASEGKDVSYYISEDGHTLYAYTGDNEDSQTPPTEEQLVFRVEISNPESSSAEYTFTLLEQIDHEDNKGENFIDLTFDYKVVDKANNDPQGELEGDTAENRFTVRVVDDVPELARDEDNNLVTVNGLVHEDALDNDFSTGNGESDADPQQTVSAGGGASGSGGSLSSLFREGADRPVVHSITKDTDKLSDASIGLKSKGEEVTYAVEDLRDSYDSVIGQRLTGYVDNSDDGYDGKPSDESEDRVVFTLEVEASSGDWSFELNDQLDHEAGSGDSGVTLVNGNGALDFTGLIEVTDHDADTVNLGDLAASSVGAGEEAPSLFTVTVENDVPYLKPASEGGIGSISGIVQEDALEDDGTGNPDLSQGNPDSGSDAKTITGSTNNDNSLSLLISAGADEEIRAYGVISDVGAIGAALGGVTSKGKGLVYTSDGQTVTAYADEDNSGDVSTGDREVFTLTVNSTTGDWSFELNDQLDHVDGAGDDGTLLKNNGSNTDPISSLNFSEVITVTDYDNDTVTLYEATGKDTVFTVTVENDVPVAVNDSGYSVGEGGIGDSEDDDALNAFISDSDNEKFFDSGNVLDNDSVGADEDLVLQSFTYINESGDKVSGDLDQWVNTVYGAFKLESNGDFFYVSDLYSKHSTNQNTLYESITYFLKDADGDEDDAELKIGITDTAPGIQAPDSTTIHEKYLPTGSAPDSDKLTNTESITFTRAADPVNVVLNYFSVDKLKEASLYEDVNGESVATFDDLTSKGAEVSYDISNDKRTITAFVDSDGNGVYDLGDSLVFTLEIIGYDGDSDPDEFTQDDDLNYTFTLYRALDHTSPVERSTDQIDMTFEVMMYDYQEDANDYVKTGIGIAIMDDEPGASTVTMVVDEDSEDSSPENTITTSADGDGTNLTISTGPSHGSAEVNDNGTITYTPDPDYSGDDQFEYTYTDEDEVDHIITVDVTVNPISDAPGVSSDSSSVSTPEDVAVVLGFNVPTVTDDNDQTDPAADDIDNPERLGLITLSGVPAGAQLRYGTSSAHDATGADITIFLTDGDHIAGAQADATLSMTSSEFEAMEIIPPADTADNFTVTMKVTEYEVDSSGVPRTGVPGAESSASVVVDVQAITDPVDITWDSDGAADDSKATLDAAGDYDGSLSRDMNEDESFDLSVLIDTAFIDEPATSGRDTNEADLDGSEYREIVLENLPEGSVVTVDGTDYTIGSSGTISIPFDNEGYGSELPTIELAPPADFSGDIDGITVTLQSTDHEPSGETDSAPYIITEKDSITLNLHVYPVAGDVTAPDVETTEDTPVRFLENLEVTDASNGVGNGGKETIIDIVIKDIPDGWVLNAGSTTIIGDGTTDYTVTNAHLASKAYLDYTLTPPAHSSTDGTVTVSVTTEDKSNVDGPPNPDTDTKTTDLEISVKVTPVAERIGTDSDEDGQTDTPLPDIADTDENGTADLQMNPSHTYEKEVLEDRWFDLSSDGQDFELKNGWDNEDADEDTYALMTPKGWDPEGNEIELSGSEFRYTVGGDEVVKQFTADPIAIPVNALGTLEFLATPNYAGEVVITVNALTVDRDDDQEDDPSALADQKITGETELSFTILPESDLTSINTYSPGGDEDTLIPLYIRPVTEDQDGSEIIEITINGLPEGAELYYSGTEIQHKLVLNGPSGDGTYSVTIGDVDNGQSFDPAAPLFILPPDDSNEDFINEISIVGTSNDSGGSNSEATVILGDIDTIPVKVDVRGGS